MQTIYIFRHAQAESGENDKYRTLSEEGLKQTIEMKKSLPSFDFVISSPAVRTFVTASLLNGSREIEILDPLYDLVKSPKVSKAYSRLKNATPKEWYEDEEIGEMVKRNADDYMPRIKEVIEKADEDSNILIVTHAVVANIIAKKLMNGYVIYQKLAMSHNLGECEAIKVKLDIDLVRNAYRIIKYEV